MMTSLLLLIIIPLLAALIPLVIRSQIALRNVLTSLSALLLFGVALSLYPTAGLIWPSVTLFTLFHTLSFTLSLEPIGLTFALLASFLWFVTSIYAASYAHANALLHQPRFFCCFALSIAATMGIATAGNLFTLFVCYELLTLVTYPLVAHHGDLESRRNARAYLFTLLFCSFAFLLPAILLTQSIAGTTTFTEGGVFTKPQTQPMSEAMTAILLGLFLFGTAKAALMPFHKWLPQAMVAPTPVSALLHAVAVVKAGVFTILKIVVYIFGVENLQTQFEGGFWSGSYMLWVALFTMIMGSVIALNQTHLKLRLAYSTISQLATVVVTALVLAPYSMIAAVMQLVAHGVAKITLFFAAGAIYTAQHKTQIGELDGIGRQMPVTMIAFTIASLSLIGLPMTGGFLVKYYATLGAIQMEQWPVIMALLISTLLNAAYFMPIILRAFFAKTAPQKTTLHDAPVAMQCAILISTLAIIVLFFWPDWLLHMIEPLFIESGEALV